MMSDKILPFKNADAAMDYVEKYFKPGSLNRSKRFVGSVKAILDDTSPEVFLVEVCLRKGVLFKRKERQLVAAALHPDLFKDDPRLARGETVTEAPEPMFRLREGDLVYWGFDRKKHGAAAGWILDRLSLNLDLSSGEFIPHPK